MWNSENRHKEWVKFERMYQAYKRSHGGSKELMGKCNPEVCAKANTKRRKIFQEWIDGGMDPEYWNKLELVELRRHEKSQENLLTFEWASERKIRDEMYKHNTELAQRVIDTKVKEKLVKSLNPLNPLNL